MKLRVESVSGKLFQKILDNLGVSPVIKAEYSVSVDGDVIHHVGEARRTLIFRRAADSFRYKINKLFTVAACDVVVCCEC